MVRVRENDISGVCDGRFVKDDSTCLDEVDRKELGTLLEDDTQANGLVADWVAVKQACNKIDRRHRWLDDIDLVRPSIEKSKV